MVRLKVHNPSLPKTTKLGRCNTRFGIVNAEALGQRSHTNQTLVKKWRYTCCAHVAQRQRNQCRDNRNDSYEVNVKQMYATGLQVAKDPGVWIVYIGCGLMLLGLYMAFFISHRRVWLYLDESSAEHKLLLGGNSNKNKIAFNQIFTKLEEHIEKLS